MYDGVWANSSRLATLVWLTRKFVPHSLVMKKSGREAGKVLLLGGMNIINACLAVSLNHTQTGTHPNPPRYTTETFRDR
ncbi:hypothetical protein CCYS_04330 [Corynebacterium cystitidis DSM 20524]|uniref:Transposase DDE domain-containing protein n=1 Tax=Corynebacterium cystitidis DSM 20524 TaxID=1121357 RepID=A0A1H9QFK2_9CORY|nr:hypothetical protein CCYS_04330 [Corynebacterium cystitidis DSM 20524]SER58955.1 hypothetical protein SAMN05661109_00501 [Corynebacterium cystitidis DSM 20524]SNV83294.1 Uncharacterised protein [Corynebacterium cystitidis]